MEDSFKQMDNINHYALVKRKKRFNQLHRELRGISDKVLTTTLKELEQNDLILREIYYENVIRVEYSLTEKGKMLIPIINQLVKWYQNPR